MQVSCQYIEVILKINPGDVLGQVELLVDQRHGPDPVAQLHQRGAGRLVNYPSVPLWHDRKRKEEFGTLSRFRQ